MHLLVEEFLKDNLEFKLDILETLENHREEFIDWRRARSPRERGEGWAESVQPQCRCGGLTPIGRLPPRAQPASHHGSPPRLALTAAHRFATQAQLEPDAVPDRPALPV